MCCLGLCPSIREREEAIYYFIFYFHISDTSHRSGKQKFIRAVVQSKHDSWLHSDGKAWYTPWKACALTHLTGSSSEMNCSYGHDFLSWNSVISLYLCRMEESIRRMELGDKQLSIWTSYFNPLLWISLG